MYNELKGPDISFLLTAKGKDPAAQIFFSFSAKVGAVFGICTLKFCMRFFPAPFLDLRGCRVQLGKK